MANEGDAERLVVLLEARIRDFEKNMQKAGGTARRNFGDMRRGSQSATRAIEEDFVRTTQRINQLLASTSTRIGSFGRAFGSGFLGGLTSASLDNIVAAAGRLAKGIATIGDEAKRAGLSTRDFQQLKYVAEQNRVGVDSLRVPEAGRLVWDWFVALSNSRSYNVAGPNPISHADMEAFARLHRWPIEARHVELIRAMDAAYLDREDATPARPAAGPGLPITPAAFDAVFG